MTSVAIESDFRGQEPLAHHSDDLLAPDGRGNAVVFLGKEALLAWFTDIRTKTHGEVLERFYHLCHSRASFTTSVYQLVEVFTKIRYEQSAEATLLLSLARERRNRNTPVYLFTFDGTLATLADTFRIPVLPYSTPLRDDGGR